MQSKIYPKLLFLFLLGALHFTACGPDTTAMNPSPNAIPAATEGPPQILVPATAVSVSPLSSNTGTTVTFGSLTLVLPSEVASGASGSDYPPNDSEDAAWWQKTPGHLLVMLGDYYPLQGTLHEPQIYLYPAQAYAEMVPAAFESIRRLDNILYGSVDSIPNGELPAVPFFNAQPLLASNIQTISFQNGGGVRFLTEYGQFNAPINNKELFYHFQGMTRDGAYYIIAILPVTVPTLVETSDPTAVLPPGGIASPDIADPDAGWSGYYTAVTDLLNDTSTNSFVPSINQLDLLIESMQVGP